MSATRGEKPYRVYRGGRVKGKVPTIPRPTRERNGDGDGRSNYRGPGAKRPATGWRGWSWKRWTGLTILAVFLFLFFWILAAYLSFRGGVKDANKRLPESARLALVPDNGMMLGHASDILLLGTDHSLNASRASDQHSDSIQILRTDPKHHKLIYLSIPRDLRVPNIPGHGPDKINAAFQIGGARLAARTVHEYTGLPINHIVVVNFHSFSKLIDKLGGIDINVPAPILSNKFDCPYATQARCDRWQGWRFAKGMQHMNGQRARVYSRIRENKLNPRESDVTRTERQQAVIQALLAKLTSVGVLAKLPFMGGDVMKPLTTDLTAGQMMQLALVKKRSGNQLHCHLGGTPTGFGGGYLQPDEEARRTIAAFLGRSAPQPPLPGSTYGSGCT